MIILLFESVVCLQYLMGLNNKKYFFAEVYGKWISENHFRIHKSVGIQEKEKLVDFIGVMKIMKFTTRVKYGWVTYVKFIFMGNRINKIILSIMSNRLKMKKIQKLFF